MKRRRVLLLLSVHLSDTCQHLFAAFEIFRRAYFQAERLADSIIITLLLLHQAAENSSAQTYSIRGTSGNAPPSRASSSSILSLLHWRIGTRVRDCNEK